MGRRRPIWCATMMAPMDRLSQIESGRWGFGTARYHRGPPWQNAYVERLIGTLRRECLDHVLIYGERHLRRILTLYSLYYNETRTHLGLAKDAPLGRYIERSGTIVTTPILSGLHHRYARI
jgi:transposase InsO family protein